MPGGPSPGYDSCRMTTVGEVLEAIDLCAPFRTAAGWDAVGLQIGDVESRVSAVAVVHEITGVVAERLLSERYDLVITYHPLIFRPLRSVTAASGPEGRSYEFARAGVAVIAVHTNWDAAVGGTADALASVLHLEESEGFAAVETLAGDEMVVGRCGRFPGGTRGLLPAVQQVLGTRPRSAGLRDITGPRVGVLPGSGGGHVDDALLADVDIYLTGDVSHHEARRAIDHGMAVVDAGHAPTERPGVRALHSLVEQIVDNAVDLVDIDDDPWEGQWNR